MGLVAAQPSVVKCDAYIVPHPLGAVNYRTDLVGRGAIPGFRRYADYVSALEYPQPVGDFIITENGGEHSLDIVHVAKALSNEAMIDRLVDTTAFVGSAMNAAGGARAASVTIPLSSRTFGNVEGFAGHAREMVFGIMEYWRVNPYGAPHYVFFAVDDDRDAFEALDAFIKMSADGVGYRAELGGKSLHFDVGAFLRRTFTPSGRCDERLSEAIFLQLGGYSTLGFVLKTCEILAESDFQIFNTAIVGRLAKHLDDYRAHIRSSAVKVLKILYLKRPDLRNSIGEHLARVSLEDLTDFSNRRWDLNGVAAG